MTGRPLVAGHEYPGPAQSQYGWNERRIEMNAKPNNPLNQRHPMKKTFLLASVGVAVVAGATLLVGNDQNSSPSPANPSPPPAAVTNLPAPAPAATEPIPEVKIVTAPAVLSPGVDEVVQLARARVGDEVMLAYVEASTNAFQLSADEIIYLHDVGVSAEVVAAMVRHGQALRDKGVLPADAVTNAVASSAAPAARESEPSTAEAPPAPTETAAAPEAPTNGTQPVTYNYFHNTLSPYGNWVQVADYGWCWQPTVSVVDTSWQPYCDNGRWVHTDSGWYWNSYYSWGWAPFHYGRWHRHQRHGWVWMPGTTWGPAWVTWRYSNGYCGWAPLPPACGYVSGLGLTYYGSRVSFGFGFGLGWDCYSYVPTSRFYCADPWRYRVHRSHGIHVHNNSTVINNYVTGNNNTTIINVGPGTTTIAAATRSEIRKVTIQDAPAAGSTTIRAEQLSRDGRTLAVYRPKLPQQASVPPSGVLRRQEQVGKQTEMLASSPAVRRASDRVREEGLTKPRRLGGATTSSPGPSTSPAVTRSEPTAPSPRAEGSPSGKPGNSQPSVRTEPRGNGSVAGPAPTSPGARPDLTKPRSVPNSPTAVPTRTEPQARPTSPPPASSAAPRNESVTPKPRAPERSSYETPAPRQTPSAAPAPAPKPRSEASRTAPSAVWAKPPSVNASPALAQKPAAPPSYRSEPRSEPVTPRSAPSQPAFRPSIPQSAPAPVVTPPRYSAPVAPSPQPSRSYSPAPQPAPAPRAPAMSRPAYSAPSVAPAPRSMPSPPPSSFSKNSRGQ